MTTSSRSTTDKLLFLARGARIDHLVKNLWIRVERSVAGESESFTAWPYDLIACIEKSFFGSILLGDECVIDLARLVDDSCPPRSDKLINFWDVLATGDRAPSRRQCPPNELLNAMHYNDEFRELARAEVFGSLFDVMKIAANVEESDLFANNSFSCIDSLAGFSDLADMLTGEPYGEW